MFSGSQTIEAWAERYVLSESLSYKLCPDPAPSEWNGAAKALRLQHPGRPSELRLSQKGGRVPADLAAPSARAKLLHTFFHHELQAAELMCWALLAFDDAELEYRRGLLRICHDEIRHMQLYRDHIQKLGYELGDFKVRDWFWSRVPACQNKLEFVSLMGMGLEAANLEHSVHFAQLFADAGDLEGALLQQRIGNEEVAHVAFGIHWFERWTLGQDFETWKGCLPLPLSPLLMRGKGWNQEGRERAGMQLPFLEKLRTWQP